MKTVLSAGYRHLFFLAALCCMMLNACTGSTEKQNVLTDEEKQNGFTLLFDGETMNGWHIYNKGDIPSAWTVDSGKLICNPHAKNVKHGDLTTDKEFTNYELRFDWKISKAGNSGLFINVQESPEYGSTFSTGPEYQLLDDQGVEPDYIKDLSHKAGSVFGVVPNKSESLTKSGEWNSSRILQENGKFTFWLNGVETVSVDLKGADWAKMIADGPMSRYPGFGKAVKGHIALQDWTNGVEFRNIRIREN